MIREQHGAAFGRKQNVISHSFATLTKDESGNSLS